MTSHRTLSNMVRVPHSGSKYDMLLLDWPPDWMADSPCASVDPALFHPDVKGKRANRKAIEQLCWGSCTVREQCLEYALKYESGQAGTAYSDAFGVFGGLNAQQRKAILKQRAMEAQS